MNFPRLSAILFAALALLPAAAGAQHALSDTVPLFRRGQWGAGFDVNLQYVSGVSILRFRDERRAWIASARVYASERKIGIDSAQGGTGRFKSGRGATTLRVGNRRYSRASTSTAVFGTAGVSATHEYGHDRDDGAAFRYVRTGGGLFGEIGGNYLLTRRLALGAVVRLDAGYLRTRVRNGVVVATTDEFVANVVDPVVTLTLLF